MTTMTEATQTAPNATEMRRTIRIRCVNADIWVSRLTQAGVYVRFLGPGTAKKYDECASHEAAGTKCPCRITRNPEAWGNLEIGCGGNKAHKIFMSLGGYPDEASDI